MVPQSRIASKILQANFTLERLFSGLLIEVDWLNWIVNNCISESYMNAFMIFKMSGLRKSLTTCLTAEGLLTRKQKNGKWKVWLVKIASWVHLLGMCTMMIIKVISFSEESSTGFALKFLNSCVQSLVTPKTWISREKAPANIATEGLMLAT